MKRMMVAALAAGLMSVSAFGAVVSGSVSTLKFQDNGTIAVTIEQADTTLKTVYVKYDDLHTKEKLAMLMTAKTSGNAVSLNVSSAIVIDVTIQ